jgi:hypothetical protein
MPFNAAWENELRDERGRWTEGGGASSSGDNAADYARTLATHVETLRTNLRSGYGKPFLSPAVLVSEDRLKGTAKLLDTWNRAGDEWSDDAFRDHFLSPMHHQNFATAMRQAARALQHGTDDRNTASTIGWHIGQYGPEHWEKDVPILQARADAALDPGAKSKGMDGFGSVVQNADRRITDFEYHNRRAQVIAKPVSVAFKTTAINSNGQPAGPPAPQPAPAATPPSPNANSGQPACPPAPPPAPAATPANPNATSGQTTGQAGQQQPAANPDLDGTKGELGDNTKLGVIGDDIAKALEGKKVIIIVGGFADKTLGHIMQNYSGALVDQRDAAGRNKDDPKIVYFTYEQTDKLAAYLKTCKNKKDVAVIGHSYGGDTAATAVKKVGGIGALVTIDPVSRIRPDFVSAQPGARTDCPRRVLRIAA